MTVTTVTTVTTVADRRAGAGEAADAERFHSGYEVQLNPLKLGAGGFDYLLKTRMADLSAYHGLCRHGDVAASPACAKNVPMR